MLRVYFLVLLAAVCIQGEENDAQKKIVGGQDAPDGAFPWQVSLRNTDGREYHFCGGSIVNKKWILSAAHCTVNRKPNSFVVVVGTNKLSSGGKRYKVSSITNHEKYNAGTLYNDISVIKLADEIEYNDKVKAVEMDQEYVNGGEECTISGWGYTDNYRQVPDKLQMLKVQILSVDDCTEKLKIVRGPKYTKDAICAYNKPREGICQGDSGGPLVKNNKQVGVVSWNVPCGRGYPDVYTRVSSYNDWIKTHTKN